MNYISKIDDLIKLLKSNNYTIEATILKGIKESSFVSSE